jgi:hypothetical protein
MAWRGGGETEIHTPSPGHSPRLRAVIEDEAEVVRVVEVPSSSFFASSIVELISYRRPVNDVCMDR